MIAPRRPDQHILTIALEDYFQVGAFNRFVQKNQWYRFETRLEKNTDRALDLLKRHDAKATFFVLGWIAKRFPELVRKVADAGHEVAIKGYYHRSIRDMAPEEFEADCQRAKDEVEAAAHRKVVGYRLADGWFGPEDLWALDSLAKLGFGYDSSIAPIRRAFVDQPYRRIVHPHHWQDRTLWEVPISTARVLGVRVPIAGGNYLRQFPWWLMRRAIAKWDATHAAPLVSYFHVWELDPDQPRLAVGSWFTQMRHYRNLDQMETRLGELLHQYRFTSAADYLDLKTEPDPSAAERRGDWHSDTDRVEAPASTNLHDTATALLPANREKVSIIVPCFNEEEILPYLANTLQRVREALIQQYDVKFLLVDDGSSDRTWDGLNAMFADKPWFDLVRHDVNCGVAAAIQTGLKRASTEIVCSMDCDCTYDPLELANMIPLLQPGVDLVTASPYHPDGQVRNVPGWRLGLSKGAAWLYRRVLRQKLYTYTSCFRVYRRSAVAGLPIQNGRYLGVAELLGRLDLSGGKIVEYPATLEVRMLGRSKMKTVRTILGHLRLMAKMLAARAFGTWAKSPRDAVIRAVIDSHRDEQPVLIRQHATAPPPPDPDNPDVRKLVLHPERGV